MNTTISGNSLPIHSDPEIMGGTPVFVGTRVPAQTLFDYLADGCDLEEFLDNFPTVSRDQALQLLEQASETVLAKAGCLMKILIDESLPRYLKRLLPDHEAKTVQDMGWAGIKNGKLLKLAEPDFDIFLRTYAKNRRKPENLGAHAASRARVKMRNVHFTRFSLNERTRGRVRSQAA